MSVDHPQPAVPPGLVPQPPPGPGVAPPFVAPPTDGTRQRRWLAVGLAGGAALVLCVGGLFGLGGLVVFGGQMVVQQSQAVVTHYLDALKAMNYDEAYDLLCPAQRNQVTKYEFSLFYALQPEIDSFTVGQPELTDQIMVPARIMYTNLSAHNAKYVVQQDTATSNYEVCGEVD